MEPVDKLKEVVGLSKNNEVQKEFVKKVAKNLYNAITSFHKVLANSTELIKVRKGCSQDQRVRNILSYLQISLTDGSFVSKRNTMPIQISSSRQINDDLTSSIQFSCILNVLLSTPSSDKVRIQISIPKIQ